MRPRTDLGFYLAVFGLASSAAHHHPRPRGRTAHNPGGLMHTRIVTTITTDIDLETFAPSHSVEIDAEDDGLPTEAIYAAVAGACKATLNSLPASTRALADDDAPASSAPATESGQA